MRRTATRYLFLLLAFLIVVLLAAIPIVASDLFQQPYSPVWPRLYRIADLFRIDPFPTGGGAPPKFPFWRDPADAGIFYRDVTLTTADGLALAAWYVPAAQRPQDAPTIVLAHGLQDSRRTLLHLVPWLHGAGYNVMLFDFRGHGASDKVRITVGRTEALDVHAALGWLEAEGVAGKVGGLGMSMGAVALVNAAASAPRLEALVLDSMFSNWGETDFAAGYRLPPDWLVPGVPSPERLVSQLHIPMFFVHGTADILVSVDHAFRLYEAAHEPEELWINDSGHAWSSWTYPEDYRKRILAFFRDALGDSSY
jgi:dipeptidyl aminopeptidase/acylaminoacyl peptidase